MNPFELDDTDLWLDIVEDVLERCRQFGVVTHVVVPRPRQRDPENVPPATCVDPEGWAIEDFAKNMSVEYDWQIPTLGGCSLVEFTDVAAAQRCQEGLAGAMYRGRQLLTGFFPEQAFQDRDFV